jgi:hypothetical protein
MFASKTYLLAGCVLALASVPASVEVAAQSAAPDFSSNGTAWQAPNGGEFLAVPGSPAPNRQDPAHPFVSNAEANRTGKQPNYRLADLSNPNIKQWAKDIMKKDNDEVLKGKIAYTPGQSCEPSGIPYFMLTGGPYFFVQTPKQVLIITEGERTARRIHMNVPHSKDLKPSWYGESVGRYEGDTLVVDTIGLNAKTFVDNYRTPHTEKLHVVERYRVVEDGKALEVNLEIDDPGAFNAPWKAKQRYRRTEQGPLPEVKCSENNIDFFDLKGFVGSPTADKPDF